MVRSKQVVGVAALGGAVLTKRESMWTVVSTDKTGTSCFSSTASQSRPPKGDNISMLPGH